MIERDFSDIEAIFSVARARLCTVAYKDFPKRIWENIWKNINSVDMFRIRTTLFDEVSEEEFR